MYSAPKDGTEIVCWVGEGYKGGIIMLSWNNKAWRDWDQEVWEPTHWMYVRAPS